jgi:hypothetical protein
MVKLPKRGHPRCHRKKTKEKAESRTIGIGIII